MKWSMHVVDSLPLFSFFPLVIGFCEVEGHDQNQHRFNLRGHKLMIIGSDYPNRW